MASVSNEFTYDVFLSFRGEDTRYSFTGNLWKALHDRGIHTFMDDEELRKGDEITPSLVKAIEGSNMAIIVLSKNYASSSFCLQELSNILDSTKEKGRLVWPVFYEVDPSDVRKLTGSYREAMDIHEARYNINSTNMLQKWKDALHQVANLSGFHYRLRDGYEYQFIQKIVELVSREIKPVTLPVADYLVGLKSQTQTVISFLNVGSVDEVIMVGIHGIGGIGKTTLALVVYNLIARQFEGSCFLENVRENSEKHGLLYLQKILLSEIIGEKTVELTSVRQGISIIQQRLRQKKVLLIIDDVDKKEQLQAIAGRSEWFGFGSRVIITTRDKQLLKCHGVESNHEVKVLNRKDSFELLVWKAFKTESVSPIYMNVLNRAITYASGLPLALEVMGSDLFKKGIEEWECALDRYERVPNKEIQNILKVSFDALEEEEKSVFLDIACCLKGYELAKIERILHAHHGYSKKDHIRMLVEKSLIKISDFGIVTLHDLIEDMGKEIIRKESPEEPGKRSRLWSPKDIVKVLEQNRGTGKIEIIYLDSAIKVKWDGLAFKMMENLKTLVLRNASFSESPKHLPNSLRVMEWQKYPSQGLPSDFYPKKLAICNFSSDFTSLGWKFFFIKKFRNLRVLSIDCSNFLTQIPEISGLLNLEEFTLQNCQNLVTIDDSVGLLKKLTIFRVLRCKNIRSIPPLNLASLVELSISRCDNLEIFPLTVGGMVGKLKILKVVSCGKIKSFPPLKLASLEEIHLINCYSLESFPTVVDGLLGKLKILKVKGCIKIRNIPLLDLTSLEELHLLNCYNLESFPLVLGGMMGKLKFLRVQSCSNIRSFQPFRSAFLEELDLSYCGSLESFPFVADGLLGKLKILKAISCTSIRIILPLNMVSLEELDLSYCVNLESFPHVDGSLGKLKILSVKGCRKVTSIPPLKLALLEELNLSYCNNLESFPPVVDGLIGKLKILRVTNCNRLKSIPPLKLASLEELDLSDCVSLESFPHILDDSLEKLKILIIKGCRKLKNIPFLKWASLEHFDLSYCVSLQDFAPVAGGLFGKLRILNVKGCRNLKKIPPLRLASLEQPDLSYCTRLKEFPPVADGLLCKHRILNVKDCWKLKSIPPLMLTSLEQLDLSCCPNLESFPPVVDGFLGKLRILNVKECKKLRSIPPLMLSSLEKLDLSYCTSLESFPHVVDGVLAKLKILIANHCRKLTNFPSEKFMSLEQLDISHCVSLESFPPLMDGLLDKLKLLRVNNCSKLKTIPPLKLPSIIC